MLIAGGQIEISGDNKGHVNEVFLEYYRPAHGWKKSCFPILRNLYFLQLARVSSFIILARASSTSQKYNL